HAGLRQPRLDVHVPWPFQQPFPHPSFYFRLGQPPGIWIQAAEQDEADVGITSFDSPCRLGVLDNAFLAQQAGGEQERQWLDMRWLCWPLVEIDTSSVHTHRSSLRNDTETDKKGLVVVVLKKDCVRPLQGKLIQAHHAMTEHKATERLMITRRREHEAKS